MNKFKVGNRVIEKYKPFKKGTVIEIFETFYRIKMKSGIRLTNGQSFQKVVF